MWSPLVFSGTSFKEGTMTYSDFVWFLLAEEDKRHPRRWVDFLIKIILLNDISGSYSIGFIYWIANRLLQFCHFEVNFFAQKSNLEYMQLIFSEMDFHPAFHFKGFLYLKLILKSSKIKIFWLLLNNSLHYFIHNILRMTYTYFYYAIIN